MILIRCPCCRGKKELRLEDGRRVTWVQCCHCDGKGTVPAELPRQADGPEGWPEHLIITAHSSPGLQRSELSREAKRDHLLGLRVAPDDAAKILAELYGSEE